MLRKNLASHFRYMTRLKYCQNSNTILAVYVNNSNVNIENLD